VVETAQITSRFGFMIKTQNGPAAVKTNVSVVISNTFMLPSAEQLDVQTFSAIDKNTPFADQLFGSETLYIKLTSTVDQGVVLCVYSEEPQGIMIDYFAKQVDLPPGTQMISVKIPDPVVNTYGAITAYDSITF
jgi:hypothetical protein